MFGADVVLATVSVGVVDEDGAPIIGLTPDDFVVREDGEEREVGVALTFAGAPLDIALVLDLSSSMEKTPWRESAQAFLQQLDPVKDCVFLLGFSSGVGGSMWGRPDDPYILGSLEKSTAVGATALYDGMAAATRELALAAGADLSALFVAGDPTVPQTSPEAVAPPILSPGECPRPPDSIDLTDPMKRPRRAMVVVTDGEDTDSETRLKDVEVAALVAGVVVFQTNKVKGRVNTTNPTGRLWLRRLLPPGNFQKLLQRTAGASVPASPDAYERILKLLRGYYVVGYYVPRVPRDTRSELIRHEVEVRLRDRDADISHPEAVYRRTVDTVGAAQELAIARKELEAGDVDAALLAVNNAMNADPDLGAAAAFRARLYERLGRNAQALDDIARAVALAPADLEIRRLAISLYRAAGEPEVALEHAIRMAQAGAYVRDILEELGTEVDLPADLTRRLEAPRLAVIAGESEHNDVLARAALPKALRAVRRAISDAPLLGLVAEPAGAAFVVQITDRDIDQEPPRRFRGRIRVLDAGGDKIYDEGLTLKNVDDPDAEPDDVRELTRHVREILAKIARIGR